MWPSRMAAIVSRWNVDRSDAPTPLLAGEPQMRQHDRWLSVGSLLADTPQTSGDCWQEPTKALWLLAKFLKKVNNFNGLLAWHSRGRGFDSLQLHQEECQGVTEKSVTPFSLAPCQLTANAPVGSDSPVPGRLARFPPHPRGRPLENFQQVTWKKFQQSPKFFASNLDVWTFPMRWRRKMIGAVPGGKNAPARRGSMSA